jgi:ParB/RepB/Spo0J family partition protein
VPKDASRVLNDLVALPSGRPQSPRTRREGKRQRVQRIPVGRIRPEDGLGRQRDREGHRELRQSIEQFGVITPVTVRVAPDDTGDYLLIKGQGRTLACRMLGIDKIPAIVLDDEFTENEKVQQFLVENVARLRMRPMDRALLIARAREDGEETADVAKRFGVSPATVRRLEAQLEGASTREVAALKQGNVNLTVHAVIAKYVGPSERSEAVAAIAPYPMKAKDLEILFKALGWQRIVDLGSGQRGQRLLLLTWACATFNRLPAGSAIERLHHLAAALPIDFGGGTDLWVVTR